MARRPPSEDIEINVGPHPARPDWSVLRVTFRRTPEHQRRVAAAVGAMLPAPTPHASGDTPEPERNDDAA